MMNKYILQAYGVDGQTRLNILVEAENEHRAKNTSENIARNLYKSGYVKFVVEKNGAKIIKFEVKQPAPQIVI